MINLLQERRRISRRFLPKGALFLDYDGTLTPIVATADQAKLASSVREKLQFLAKRLPLIVVISGRSLKDVKQRVGVSGIIYAGNHGMEIQGQKLKKRVQRKGFPAVKRRIKRALKPVVEQFPRAFLEDKILSLSLHYRLVEPKFQKVLLRESNDCLERFHAYVILRRGKKVLEIRQRVDWNKGKAVSWILRQEDYAKLVPLYIGDDSTDEDAFQVLRKKGWTCIVGESKQSAAEYKLASPEEVETFLGALVEDLESA